MYQTVIFPTFFTKLHCFREESGIFLSLLHLFTLPQCINLEFGRHKVMNISDLTYDSVLFLFFFFSFCIMHIF